MLLEIVTGAALVVSYDVQVVHAKAEKAMVMYIQSQNVVQRKNCWIFSAGSLIYPVEV